MLESIQPLSDNSKLLPGPFSGTGNRCGHQPDRPAFLKWTAPKTKREYPRVVKLVLEKLRDYYYQPKSMPTLCYLNTSKKKYGGYRQNRSEIREAEVLLLSAVYSRLDWASGRVGTPRFNGEFDAVSHKDLAAIMGDKFVRNDGRPRTRYYDAWENCARAGAWEVYKRFETNEDGDIRAKNAIKKVNFDFIVALTGISYEAISELRRYASGRIKTARQKYTLAHPGKKDQENAKEKLFKAFVFKDRQRELRKQAKKSQTPKPMPAEKKKKLDSSLAREINAYMVQLIKDNADKAADRKWLEAEVKRRYPDYGKPQ
ncbi:hypothetical protein M2404_004054 [Rheinheimera pacifica]|uniref:hypothetical protein n=1 Tax=Rheinheimera pacifica TaxID=173990 RepID=UPI002167D950|nr:hypothetical protein [Rheinheimera pacifica]MCS4309677.1 hypothetical protein [Rheinheimera pacifica]